jgi:hypothetical protein
MFLDISSRKELLCVAGEPGNISNRTHAGAVQSRAEALARHLFESELQGDLVAQAGWLSRLIDVLVVGGQDRAAQRWAEWAKRVLQRLAPGTAQRGLDLACARRASFAGESTDVLALRRDLIQGGPGDPLWSRGLSVLAEYHLSTGALSSAVECTRLLWASAQTRLALLQRVDLHVRVLRRAGELGEARSAVDLAQHLRLGLPPSLQRQVTLAEALISLDQAPSHTVALLEQACTSGLAQEGSFQDLQFSALYGLALLRLDPRQAARFLLRKDADNAMFTRPWTALLGLHPDELGALVTSCRLAPRPAHVIISHPVLSTLPTLELQFLGQPQVLLNGLRLRIRLRFAELLVALSLSPEGLTGQQLAALIYGDEGRPESCKTELSRLRHLLPIDTRPYRLRAQVRADFLSLPLLIKSGLSRRALNLYRGPLLRESDAPVVREQRGWLEELLRQAVLHCADPQLLQLGAALFPQDREVWETVVARLGPAHPQQGAAHAQLAALQRAL